MFICGQSGCDAVDIDDAAMAEANEQRKAWARLEKLKRGEFPPIVEQIDYLNAAYKRLTEIRIWQ